ncbi:pyruvate dehydrogenase [Plectosphaerella cucumerina]|uniref:Pyruvate dehydrogenase n=1 Tax=Plectosphaerella cucumerina TaxID=40658 RepID=A0A8K0WZ22_9PEZI|nr:pyruvate dehydrogenase [Plectosphaerella cucumerina]
MQSLHVAPRRLGSVSVRSFLQKAPRRLFSTKPPSPGSRASGNGSTTSKGYIAIGTAVAGASGVWWLNKSRSSNDIPSLNTQIVSSSPFSPEHVTAALSKDAYSVPVSNVPGVARYDGAQVPSNSPCEDRFIHGRFSSPRGDGSDWLAWAVFDGHAGWQTANLLEDQLLPAVRHSLSEVIPSSTPEGLNATVQSAITKAFISLDDAIMRTAATTVSSDQPLQDKMRKLLPGYAGSCALLALFDPVTSTLYVACTGDSRAVLGRKASPSGRWEATPLSVDQNGSNAEEIARISAEHPGEDSIAKGGRVLGLAVSRAFGDGRWKWPMDLQEDLRNRFQGLRPLTGRYNVLTPPYLTAEPVVTVTTIERGVPSFLVMASDGLWDFVSNQQAVDLTGKWLETPAPRSKSGGSPAPAAKPLNFGQLGNDVSERFVDERTTVVDDNAAVHLVRNALGGKDQQLLAGRLAVQAPFSRNIRDDTTVQVIFFTGST